jgi:hypothetical protein
MPRLLVGEGFPSSYVKKIVLFYGISLAYFFYLINKFNVKS